MGDQHMHKTLICLPGAEMAVESCTPAGHLITKSLHAPEPATARTQRGSDQVGKAVRRLLDTRYVVSRLLAEGVDIEETLTRLCDILRDSMGWNDVSFWPADRLVSVLPTVRAGVVSDPSYAHYATAQRVSAHTDVEFDGHSPATGSHPNEIHEPQNAGGKTASHTSSVLGEDAQSTFSFPVRGMNGLLGVIACSGERADRCDASALSEAAALGPAIGQFIEQQQRESAKQSSLSVTEHATIVDQASQMDPFAGAFDALEDSVLVFDAAGRILQANAADRILFGYDPQSNRYTSTLRERRQLLRIWDERGQPIPEERLPSVRILHGETLHGQHAVEAMLRTPDGRDIRASISGAPIYDDGNLTRGVVVTRDVTACRQHERAMEETNRLLKDLLAVAAHDLRTPITSTRGYIQLATRRLSSVVDMMTTENPTLVSRIRDVRRTLEDAEESTLRLTALVDRLLDVARIQADKLDVRPVTANLVSIVRTAVREQRLMSPTRVIRCKFPPMLAVPTLADPIRTGQVLANYLANALKYSSEDSVVVVTLEVRRVDARVSVRDEGPGIPLADRERIWSRFEQLDSAARWGSDSGLGLGLYISRAIVEAHGGRVGVMSAPGHGSTFWFSLPLAHSVE